MRKEYLENISFRTLLRSLVQYREGIVQAILLYLIWSILELSIPLLTQLLVDQGIGYRDLHLIVIILLAQLMFFFGIITSDFFKNWILRHIGVRMNIDVIDSYINRVINKNILFFSSTREGSLIQHVNDNMRIEKFLTEGIMTVLNAVFKLLLFTLVLLYFSGTVALVFFGSILLLIIWDISFLSIRERIDNNRFEVQSDIRSELVEVVHGIHDIKVNSLQERRISAWNKLQQHIARVRLNILGIHQYYKGGTMVITHIRDVLILFFTAYAVLQGQLTLGVLLAVQYILGQSNQPTIDIMQFVQDHQDAKLSMRRLGTIFEDESHEEEILEEEYPAYRGTIKVDDVKFTYPGSNKGVRDLNFEIPYGSKVAVVGESGSGKSTMFNLLLGMLRPEQGEIRIGDLPKNAIFTEGWMKSCSVLSQDGFVFNGDIRYNISLEKDKSEIDFDRLNQAMRISQFTEVADELEHSIETKVGYNAKNLSKGQVQRLLLARALYKKSEYFILDEPTSALDNKTARNALDQMMEKFADRTIFIATHKIHLTQHMDLILIIERGRLRQIGSPEEIFGQTNSWFELYDY